MVRIEFRRHSRVAKNQISSKGYNYARKIGAEQMRGHGYTHVVLSPMFLTAQTAGAFAEGAGDFVHIKETLISPALWRERVGEWVWFFEENGQKLDEKWLKDEFINDEVDRMRQQLTEMFGRAGRYTSLLLVGHAPFLELAIYALTSKIVDPLKECEGVVAISSNDGFYLESEIRL